MSARERLPSCALFSLSAGISHERAHRQLSLARQAKREGRPVAIFVACARLHWHFYLRDMRLADQSHQILARVDAQIEQMKLSTARSEGRIEVLKERRA